jgi:hypothetical protein
MTHIPFLGSEKPTEAYKYEEETHLFLQELSLRYQNM